MTLRTDPLTAVPRFTTALQVCWARALLSSNQMFWGFVSQVLVLKVECLMWGISPLLLLEKLQIVGLFLGGWVYGEIVSQPFLQVFPLAA